MNKQLLWSGAVMDPSGYGEASRNYVCSLSAVDKSLLIQIKPKYFWTGQAPDLTHFLPTLQRMSQTMIDMNQPYVFVQHLTPDNWKLGPSKCRYHIGVTTFETNSIPDHWQPQMRQMDELWTFSKWGKQVFEEAGIRRPITVVPHGVDTERYRPEGDMMVDVEGKEKIFTFGSNFDWNARKNPEALLRAYFKSFKPSDSVVLLLKSYWQYPIEHSRAYIKAQIDRIRQSMGLTISDAPPVVLISSIVPEGAMPSFYRTLDCYVLPSCGEGWGLTFTEAMATGLPTIGVNWSGNTEFMDDSNSLLVKNFKLVDVDRSVAGPQPQYAGHKWASCDVEELGQKMRWAYENRDAAKAIGAKARQDMVARSWASAARGISHRLNEIYPGL